MRFSFFQGIANAESILFLQKVVREEIISEKKKIRF